MTDKLDERPESVPKCPFCGGEFDIISIKRKMLGCPKCLHIADGAFWKKAIQAKQDLEILKQALEKYADEDMWETGHRWEVDYIQALFLEQGYKIAKEALEQINRKQD